MESDGQVPVAVTSKFRFALSAQDREDLRWYLEDFAEFPYDPAPQEAARIEQRMNELGTTLFGAVFQSSDDARDLWATIRTDIRDARIEIAAEVAASSIPWELIRDPKTDVPLALRARAFVRTLSTPAHVPRLRPVLDEPVRILLAISRPGGANDVPFRSVASRLISALGTDRDRYRLDVVRPATFSQLSEVLRAASLRAEPYHIVHFDGHGAYLDPASSAWPSMPAFQSPPRPGWHGYLAFEHPTAPDNVELVGGSTLGALLAEVGSPIMVLNACRSAHNLLSPAPAPIPDPHAQVRSFGSLAQELMDAGVAGVVAMGYNVYVVTAAQFIADLYAALARGSSLGEAATMARKQLDAAREREIAGEQIELQDWIVPIVYEAVPLPLFAATGTAAQPRITIRAAHNVQERGAIDRELPPPPDAGFFGRDETLLALDRRFDTQNVVLVHALAGSGKTATAAEFARWYALTGGVIGPIVFTSFEQPVSLGRVLDHLEPFFRELLNRERVHWLALDDQRRRDVALHLMRQTPVLWIWDNVEEVAGFPNAGLATLDRAEQEKLARFLRDARDTKARFLLTSRRDEHGWLGDLPARVLLPPMPMYERVQLAQALAEKHGTRITNPRAWLPLLKFTQGNPLTVTAVVGQALREGLRTSVELDGFLAELQSGAADLDDDESQARPRSLTASLNYGFAHAFSEDERKHLALLYLFREFVDVNVLVGMSALDDDWPQPEIQRLAPEMWVEMLDRATSIGQFTRLGRGYWAIHPALPWHFAQLFEEHYGMLPLDESMLIPSSDAAKALRAFVTATAHRGSQASDRFGATSDPGAMLWLRMSESNLLHARQLARRYAWWHEVMFSTGSLLTLYEHAGRWAEWDRLVEEVAPDFLDPITGESLPGKEEHWSFITNLVVRVAYHARDWSKAERLQLKLVEHGRRRAVSALAMTSETMNGADRSDIRFLASELHELGLIRLNSGQSTCIPNLEEAWDLWQRVGERAAQAQAAINLGIAHLSVDGVRDLVQAERWLRISLDLLDDDDRRRRSTCVYELATIAFDRFREAQMADWSNDELDRRFDEAMQLAHQALALTPHDAKANLARRHQFLGRLYGTASNWERAMHHLGESIRLHELLEDFGGAAQTRFDVAIGLATAGRLRDARTWASAALRGFREQGDHAMVADVENFLAQIGRVDGEARG